MQRYADCVHCHRTIKLRETGSDEVYGSLWKHRRPDGLWCEGGGQFPPPVSRNSDQIKIEMTGLEPGMGLPSERRRVECPICHRQIKQMSNGWLYRHRNDIENAPCEGGGTDPGQDGWMFNPAILANNDNASPGLSGWYQPDPERPLTLTVAHPGGGQMGLELAEWWANQAITEIDMVVRKAIEYGATDLRDLGYLILDMAGRRPDSDDAPLPDGYATEIGIAFYAAGKLSRIVAAIKEGRRPTADSWLDLGIYVRMAQRVHQAGGWPGV